MKKLLLFTIIIIILFTQTCMAQNFFVDTYDHWAKDDINWATNTLKVFKGYGDLTFRPDNNITRSEFITVLVRTMTSLNMIKEVYKSNMDYADMNINDWSYTHVISMYEHVNKYSMNYTFKDIFPGQNFNPKSFITREEAVALIAVFATDPIFDNPMLFKDIPSDYKYYEEVRRLSNSGILSGYNDNTFRPMNNITRAESSAMIKRVYSDMKTGDKNKYLTNIEYLPIKGETVSSFFGNYDLNTKDPMDRRYIKAKNTLEYLSFGGYIFPEDTHLYDLKAIETMSALRQEGYNNIAGVNFYLMAYAKYDENTNRILSNEALLDMTMRKDLNDAEMMQLFAQISKYRTQENLYMDALKNWYYLTADNNVKANILFLRYSYYVKTNNTTMLKTLVYDDLKKGNNIDSILNINWYLTPNIEVADFKNYTFGNYYYAIYKDMTLYDYIKDPMIVISSKSNLVSLPTVLLAKKSDPKDHSNLRNYENLFYKYSLNRAFVLNFIGEKERAFVEVINDYEIIKTFNIYKSNLTQTIDTNYIGALKKLKK